MKYFEKIKQAHYKRERIKVLISKAVYFGINYVASVACVPIKKKRKPWTGRAGIKSTDKAEEVCQDTLQCQRQVVNSGTILAVLTIQVFYCGWWSEAPGISTPVVLIPWLHMNIICRALKD